jgi:sulfur-oxidizing protein SoxA
MAEEQATKRRGALAGAALALALAAGNTPAQTNTMDEIARYRQMLQDGNPAELLVARGEELWKTPRGPNKVSLERCDLGLGAGVVKGAYAQLPRYFADADQVLDFEGRLVYCMVALQGFKREDAVKNPYSGAGQRQTDIEAITTYVVESSRGMKIAVPQQHPKERAAFERGKYLFYMRGGPYDFACATCHGEDGLRIRTQNLPNFTKPEQAIRSYQGWPGYRMTGGVMHTLQWRMNDCFRQQRFPQPGYVSDTITALLSYMAVNSAGQVYRGPGIKR